MGIDTELISSKLYNLKFKNRLRDFYLYQFKHNETDFYDRGSFLDARMFVGSILVNKYDITEKEMYIIQMNHIQYDSENDEIRILIGEQSSDTAPRVINVCQPFSQMVLLLRNRNTTELFLTGNKTKPITKNNIARFRDALKKYEELREKNSDELFDYWEQIYLSTVNKAVTASTFRNDSTRLNNIIAPLAGVEWRHGSIVGFKKGEILPDKVNKHVECVTVDGKSITKNPFQELYKCCLEDSTYLGQSFLLTYFLILHFHLGSALERYDNVPFKKEELSTLNNHFKETAATLESKTRGRDPRSWSSLSQEEKCFFGKMALEKFEIVHIENRNETAKRKYDGIEESD